MIHHHKSHAGTGHPSPPVPTRNVYCHWWTGTESGEGSTYSFSSPSSPSSSDGNTSTRTDRDGHPGSTSDLGPTPRTWTVDVGKGSGGRLGTEGRRTATEVDVSHRPSLLPSLTRRIVPSTTLDLRFPDLLVRPGPCPSLPVPSSRRWGSSPGQTLDIDRPRPQTRIPGESLWGEIGS